MHKRQNDQKTPKTKKLNCHFQRARNKNMVLRAKPGDWVFTLHSIPAKGGQNTQATPPTQPLDLSSLSPQIKSQPTHLPRGAARESVLCFLSLLCSRGLNKALPQFLSFFFHCPFSFSLKGEEDFPFCHRDGVIWGYWYFSRQSWFHLVLYPVQHFAWCTLHMS